MEYVAAKTLPEVLRLLKLWRGRAKLIAGGTNIIPDMRAKFLRPAALIDISHLRSLSYIKEKKGRIRIGGLTTIAELASSATLQKYAPILAQAARQLGNPLVRNRATIAGNLAHASPAADTAVPLLVLEAMVVMQRSDGEARRIPLDQFFLGPERTLLRKDEIIREIFFPKGNSSLQMGYMKLGLRNAMAISVVSAALLMERQEGICRRVRIGLGAVAPKPRRAYETEKILSGKKVSPEIIAACCAQVQKETDPLTDIRATAEYRRSMTPVLLKRLIQQTLGVEGQ
jgi:carbon-monoxide dehydrogenase medium subunit